MSNRAKILTEKLPKDFEGAIITSNQNRFYFLGMRSSAGTLLILKDVSYFIIDFRYIELAKKEAMCENIIMQEDLYKQINEILKKHSVKKLWVEDSLTVGTLNAYNKNLEAEIEIVNPLTKAINELRQFKDEKELEYIKKAQEITDATFEYMLTVLKPGKTEIECAIALDTKMKELGAEGVAFSTILVSGENSALPHGVPGEKVIQEGDFVTMDFGAKYKGYATDMTRTVAIGHASQEMKKVYYTVLEAQELAIKEIKAGKIAKDIDKVARDHIYKNGYEGKFGHGLGHSYGIDIHENPRFSPMDESVIEEGIVMTVEPGIYLPNEFGVRIEDTIRVTKDGCVNLTKSKKELIIL